MPARSARTATVAPPVIPTMAVVLRLLPSSPALPPPVCEDAPCFVLDLVVVPEDPARDVVDGV